MSKLNENASVRRNKHLKVLMDYKERRDVKLSTFKELKDKSMSKYEEELKKEYGVNKATICNWVK